MKPRPDKDDLPETFACPECGAEVRIGARYCPVCGPGDEKAESSKSDASSHKKTAPDAEADYLDGVDLPTGYGEEKEFDYDKFLEEEFPQKTQRRKPVVISKKAFFIFVALILLGAMIFSVAMQLLHVF